MDDLKEGLTFASYELVDSFVKKWSDKNLSPLIIRSSFRGNEDKNGRIQYVCPHGIERTTKSKGGRPKQHVMYTNCTALINVNQIRKDNTWKVTKVVTKHRGHMLGPDVYGGYQKVRKMSSEDIKFVNELDGVGAARRRIAERIGEKTGQFIFEMRSCIMHRGLFYHRTQLARRGSKFTPEIHANRSQWPYLGKYGSYV